MRILKEALLFVVLLSLFSCSSPDQLEAKNVVKKFIDGLYAEDAESVKQVAPFFTELPQLQKEQLYKSVGQFSSWNIRNVKINNRRAVVIAEFSNNETTLELQIPLKSQGNSWHIQETISYSSKIDIIPAEPQ